MTKTGTYARMFLLLFMLAGTGAVMTACEEQGPLEKAGEKADEAVNDTKRAVKDAAD